MAILLKVQAETFTLENGATLITDSEATTGSSDNAVLVASGPENVNYVFGTLPVGTTKIVLFVKKQTSGISDANIGVNYINSANPQYGAFNQTLTQEGLHALEITTLPTAGNTKINIDGGKFIIDRLEFQDDTATSGVTADIIPTSVGSLTKSTGVNFFKNNGPDAIPAGSTIQFGINISGASITLTPNTVKGTIAPATVTNGGTITLTLTQAIANGEEFSISYLNAPYKNKATSVSFNVGTVTGFTDNSSNNSNIAPAFVPSSDLLVSANGASSTQYSFKIKNNGTDDIASGEVIRIVKSGLGAGTATTAKGSSVMTGDNIDITLSSSLALNEEFPVTVSLTSPATASYTGSITAQWNTNISDTSSANNSATLSYTATAVSKKSDLSVLVVSATSTAYIIKIKNNGSDAVESSSVLKIVANNVPSGTATSAKGTVVKNGLNYDLTLATGLAVNEEFTVTVTFVSVSTGYNGTLTLQWVSTISDLVASNNQTSINYSESSGGGSGSGSSGGSGSGGSNAPTQVFGQTSNTTWLDWLFPFSIFGFLAIIIIKIIQKYSKEREKNEKRNKN